MLKLADTSLILINPSPSNVKTHYGPYYQNTHWPGRKLLLVNDRLFNNRSIINVPRYSLISIKGPVICKSLKRLPSKKFS